MARQMKMPFGPIGFTIFPLVLLALASWVVALAGVSSLQHLTTGDRHAWQVREPRLCQSLLPQSPHNVGLPKRY